MNGKDKISVIIPCYNVQKYIMRCFDSIYSQTYGFENLEVILIDDLSTDNTWSILESLQRKYPENVISLKIQKKGKCGGARNLGMDICTGKYITFVDACAGMKNLHEAATYLPKIKNDEERMNTAMKWNMYEGAFPCAVKLRDVNTLMKILNSSRNDSLKAEVKVAIATIEGNK